VPVSGILPDAASRAKGHAPCAGRPGGRCGGLWRLAACGGRSATAWV